ncbi:MAG: adenylosuccinate lyase [Candidatus Iainarchaeum archaeon]|uniref:Adenylosuccinate lyase n=1 Tax=Candidatus Iainarchaeum sp. TaxID=3101447 RepID=A0A497JJB7_9ARCH|nr:MAG: adenylosuccinate lyase [Candidatus Diapherotrites archaeon]
MSFDLISPLDFRYGKQHTNIFSKYLTEEAKIKYMAIVEAAVAEVFAEFGIITKDIAEKIKTAANSINAAEVYEEEKRIKHDVRALVNCIRNKVDEATKPFVHFCLTSYDVIDTANSLRYKKFIEAELLPEIEALISILQKRAEEERDTLQIGRTHGQHALPITFGYYLYYYINRLKDRVEFIKKAKDSLVGKISGAVGCYNALKLFIDRPKAFEKRVLELLGLKPAKCSTQIIPPEPTTDLIHGIISLMSIYANLADDMRNLQRTEINEVQEGFGKLQVGSSTMPQKRNPIGFENIKSFYKEFMPRMITVYLDSISEHQRDLTNSASQRFLVEILAACYIMTKKLQKLMQELKINRYAMKRNLMMQKDLILAEPLQLYLSYKGFKDAHEKVRQLCMKAYQQQKSLLELAKQDEEIKHLMKDFNLNVEDYIGLAKDFKI